MKNWQIILAAILGGFILEEIITVLRNWYIAILARNNSSIIFYPSRVSLTAKVLFFGGGILLAVFPFFVTALIAIVLYRRNNKV
jgi:hypothetical protein